MLYKTFLKYLPNKEHWEFNTLNMPTSRTTTTITTTTATTIVNSYGSYLRNILKI